MSAEDLIRSYGETYDALRLGTAEQGEQLWLELGGPDDARLEEAADALEELVNDANRAAGQLVDEYLDEYVGTISRTPPPPRSSTGALDLAELAVDQLRDAADTYRRPGVSLRKGLADGKLYDVAMREQMHRVNAQIQTDVALAHRHAARNAMQRHELTYYRRVLTGESCDLCRIASTQRYNTGDLMPIHGRCDCRVAPIVGNHDAGRIVNRELYRELKADGTLDRFNRRNTTAYGGRSGRDRARRAASRRRARAQQRRLDGVEQLTLSDRQLAVRELGTARRITAAEADQLTVHAGRALPPAQAPTIRQHGELGPVIANERHAFSAARSADSDVRVRRPEVDVVDVPTVRPPAPAEPPVRPERSGRWTKDTPSVIRAAQRRNVDPEVIIDELELKRADRLAEQATERSARRALLDPSSSAVADLADAYDVTTDEIVANVAKVREARRTFADAATRVQLDAFEQLDTWDAVKLRRPPRAGARSGTGRVLRGGEWDWLEGLDDAEAKRLRRSWFEADGGLAPDQLGEQLRAAGLDVTDGDAVETWLEQTRRYEAAGQLRRGKLPSGSAYSGRVDIDGLLEGYVPDADEFALLPSEVIGQADGDVAGRLAQLARTSDVADAELYLEAAIANRTGDPAPWRMSFQSWEAELRELEYGLRNYPGDVRPDAADRLAELVPEFLDDPGTSYEELYERIVATSRRANLDVPDWSRIPWEGVDADDLIDDVLRQAELDELAAARRAAARADRFEDESRRAFDELLVEADTFDEINAAADSLDVPGRRQVARFDDSADVDDVVRRWDERHETTFTPGRLSTDEAVEVAATIEELEDTYPLLAGHDIVEVGELNAVIGAKNVPGIGTAGQATHPGVRFLTGADGAVVAVPRSGSAKVGVRPGMVNNVQEVGDNAPTFFSTSNPRTLTVHEYGHQVGFSAEVELLNRHLAGDIDLPGRRRLPDAERDMSALIDLEVKQVLRDTIPDVAARDGRTVGSLPKNAAFAKFVPAVTAELSEYGATNARELVAESFAEVALEGPNARPLARAITDRMRELIDAGNTRITGLTP